MKLLLLFVALFFSIHSFSASTVSDTTISRIERMSSVTKKMKAYDDAAESAWQQGEFNKSLVYSQKGLGYIKDHKNDEFEVKLLINRGIANDFLGNYTKSLSYYFKALEILKTYKNETLKGSAYTNIGLIYSNQRNTKKAIEYHTKALEIARKTNNRYAISSSLNNLAIVYEMNGDHAAAIKNYQECIRFDEANKDIRGLGDDYNNIGICYMMMKEYDVAISYYQKSIKIRDSLNDKRGIAETLNNLGSAHYNQGKYIEGETYFLEAVEIAKGLGAKELLKYGYECLFGLHEKLKNYEKAYGYYKLYEAYSDSIENIETAREQTAFELNMKFAQEKEKSRLKQEKKNAQDKLIRYSILAVLGIILVFSILLYKRWKQAQAQQRIIEEKNQLVELKNREILDSINYAKRIQTAILPSDEQIRSHIPDHFLFYLPKAIVAGDFYWIQEVDNRLYIAVADCTGHGVPGALMSVVCNNALNRSIREYEMTVPGEILDKTREIIVDEMSKNNTSISDGMDISLCCFDRDNSELTWSGANNALWIYQQNQLLEFKSDRQPIGMYDQYKPFTTHTISLESDARIFLFTDGIADQFGGSTNKKLKPAGFKDILINTMYLPIEKQKTAFQEAFSKWKGENEQVDDICILAFKLKQ